MADLVITAANVNPTNNDPIFEVVQAGETVVRGEIVYLESVTSQRYELADSTTLAAEAEAKGIAITAAAANGDWMVIQTEGNLLIGTTVVKGQLYYLSNTAGGGNIAPFADLLTTDFVTALFRGVSTTEVKLEINATGDQIT